MRFVRLFAKASGALWLLLGAAACQVLVGIDDTVEQTDPTVSSDAGQPQDGAVRDDARADTADAADVAKEGSRDAGVDIAASEASFADVVTGSTGDAASNGGSSGHTTGGTTTSITTGNTTTGMSTGGATTGTTTRGTTGGATTGTTTRGTTGTTTTGTTGGTTTGSTTGGTTGGASTGGNGSTGNTGITSGSTGSSGGGSDGGCGSNGVLYYLDRDRDGHGDPSVSSCGPGDPRLGNWVLSSDDCNDGDSRVHRGQTGYFADGYSSAAGPISFDYDCDGQETADPAVQRAPSCEQITDLLLCSGSGFDPALPARQGSGVDPYCGSKSIRTCSKSGLLTCGGTVVVSTDAAYGCR